MRASSLSFALAISGLAVFASFAGCGGSGDTNGLGGTSTTSSSGAGGSAAGGGGGQGGGSMVACGDGKLEGNEECDLGSMNGTGKGCTDSCDFECVKGDPSRDHCDDGNACNGKEVCQADHSCLKGTPLGDGTACGAGMVCVGNICTTGSCGDGVVEPPEQCDDGNVTNGDGCDSCKFTCQSGTPGACTPMDSCAGIGTCDDATHTCSAGVPLADGTACMGGFCKAGACAPAKCGDSVVDPGEQCDDGNAIKGDGCEPNCTFSCAAPLTDCPAPPVCEIAACDAKHVCTVGADATQDGKSCGGTNVCKAGACSAPSAVCGNGLKEAGEDCDFGAGNGPGTGCEANCKFSCTTNPDSCPDANTCNGIEACGAVMVGGKAGQKCSAGAALANCTACGGGLCIAGSCNVSKCGDACVDAAAGEQCEPPGTPTCDAACHKIVVPICGNGKIDGTEQCDNGNLFDLDGCDSKCNYELATRMTKVAIQGGQAPAGCMPATNRLGAQSLTGTALGQINGPLQTDITNGTTNVLTQIMGLSDLTGTAGSGFSIGVMTGTPDPLKGAWPMAGNPIDWWFLADHTTVSMGLPTGLLMNGQLVAHKLTAGPNDVTLSLLLGGSAALLHMRSAMIFATIDANPAPNVPAPPPAALAPGLTVFQTIHADAAGTQGLCGNITVDSLAQIPVPQVLTTGATACSATCAKSHSYTYCGANMPVGPNCNSLLDVLVGGCSAKIFVCIGAVNPLQPDVAAMGAVKPLTLGPGNKVPTAQSMGDNDAYSSYLTFTANRTHFTGQDCAVTADCQAGKTCTANKCQ